jgi:predicted metal-dependent hydrolase
VIPTAPLRVRNRLTEIILAALGDSGARRELAELARADAGPPDWLEKDERDYRRLVRERAQSASRALAERPIERIRSRADALDAAAVLFGAHLYFEVHELLEPHWRDAHGADRESLQGLIQAAVGYQHLANGNLAGARALLGEGRTRLIGRSLDGLDLDAFTTGVARNLERLVPFDWGQVPAFPARTRAAGSTTEKENP